jgi:putative FmdB family regulatory protein
VPTYSYVCTECDTPLEVQQSFSDDALTVCPSCEGRLRKVFSAVGVVFKGSGFYRTDSRAGNDSGGNDSGGTSTKDGDAAAKPAAAKESGGAPKSDTGTGAAASSGASAGASTGASTGASSSSKTGSAA